MALSDPFSTTYEGAFKAGTSLGSGIQSATKDIMDSVELNKKRKQAFDMLKQFGMVNTTTEEPSLDQLTQTAKDFAKQQGHDLQINTGDNPEQAKQNLMGIYKALNIPLPQGKTTTTLNLTPGTKYDPMKGEVSFDALQHQKTLPEQIAEYESANKMLETAGLNGKVSVGSKNTTISPATGVSDNLGAAGLTPDVINNSAPEDRQAMLKEKNPSYFNKLEMLKDGLMPTAGRTSKELQQMYGDAGLIFPGEVDATKGAERNKMAQNIANGDIFKSSMRGNTLVGHMDTLFNKMEELKNMQVRFGNKAKNMAEYQAGAKDIQGAKQAALAVANEMEGYLRNSNILSELGIQKQLDNIPINGSPEQQQEWMSTAGDLFNQRRNAINDTVKSVMGSKYKFDVLSERSKKILEKHGIKLDDTGNTEQQGNQGKTSSGIGYTISQ